MRYPVGAPVRLSVTVTDMSGYQADDGTLSLTVKLSQSDGTWLVTGTYSSPSHDSTGAYHQDVPAADLTAAGHYQYAWTWASGVSYGDFDMFDPFEVRVISLADAKDMLNIPASDTSQDAEIDQWIGSIESGLERFTGGPVVNRSVTERAELDGTFTVLQVRQRPLVSVQSVVSVASGSAIDITPGLDIDPNAGTIRTKLGWPFLGPYFAFRPAMLVTYTAGWGTSVPAAFGSFARIVIQHMWETQRGPLAMPMAGEQIAMVPGFGYAIPARAAELLNGSQNGIPFATEAYV